MRSRTLLFESFISRRYLLSREHKALVSVITVISIMGVMVGVAALITVIAVMDGFDETLVGKMTGTYSHLEILPKYQGGIREYEKLVEETAEGKGIVAAAPMIRRQAFLQRTTGIESNKLGAMILGVDPEQEKRVTTTLDRVMIRNPEWSEKNPTAPVFIETDKVALGFREIILGNELATRLEVVPGYPNYDTLYAITKLSKTPNGPWAKINQLKVVGTFKSGLYDVDSNFGFVTLDTMQTIFMIEDEVDVIHARVDNPTRVSEYAARLEIKMTPYYAVRTWKELSPDFFYALKLEKIAMFVILLLIVIVASFNIIGTLIMVTMQKTREIGILKSMGAGRREIKRIFLLHGIAIGILGTGLGVALGFGLCHILRVIDFGLPPAVYGIQTLPVLIKPLTVLIIVVSSFSLCVLAAVIPAIQASRMDPVEALRYE